MYAMATTAMPVYTEPGDPGVHEPEGVLTHTAEGQWVRVTGLFVTPQGKNWYQVEFGKGVGYVPAETINPGECDFSDVMLSDLRLPVSAHVGSGFNIRGNVTTANSMIRNVQVRVYTQDGSPEEPIMMASLDADARNVSLNQGAFNNVLTFRLLPVGVYRLSIRVTLEKKMEIPRKFPDCYKNMQGCGSDGTYGYFVMNSKGDSATARSNIYKV